jgi:hypothetical protein
MQSDRRLGTGRERECKRAAAAARGHACSEQLHADRGRDSELENVVRARGRKGSVVKREEGLLYVTFDCLRSEIKNKNELFYQLSRESHKAHEIPQPTLYRQ